MSGRGRGRGREQQDNSNTNFNKKSSGGRNPFASQQHSQFQPHENLQSQHFQNQIKANVKSSTNPFYISPNKTESKYESSNNTKIGIKSNFNPFVTNDVQQHSHQANHINGLHGHQQSGSRFFPSNNYNNSSDQHSLKTNNFRAESNMNTLNNRGNPFFRSASSSSATQNIQLSSQKEFEVAASVSLEKLSNILSPQTVEISIDIAELKSEPSDGIKGSGIVSQSQHDNSDVSSKRISDDKQIEKDNTTAERTITTTAAAAVAIANPFASFSDIAPDNGNSSSEYDLLSKSEFKLGRIPTVAPIIS